MGRQELASEQSLYMVVILYNKKGGPG